MIRLPNFRVSARHSLWGMCAALAICAVSITGLATRARSGDQFSKCGTVTSPERREAISEAILKFTSGKSGRVGKYGYRAPGTVTVDVYFHVITNASGTGAVSDSQIAAQIDILNAAYSGQATLPAGVTPLGPNTNTPFRFVLRGIDRAQNTTWFNDQTLSAERAYKTFFRQGTARTLNIYTNSGGGALGYSYLPDIVQSSDAILDGVVVLYTTLPGGTEVPYNEGDTVTHEVGHWLGLEHTFEGGCSKYNDYVTDTPAEAAEFFGDWFPGGDPGTIPDTCGGAAYPGLDPVDNFMDYGNDASLVRFTPEQSRRCDALCQIYRGL